MSELVRRVTSPLIRIPVPVLVLALCATSVLVLSAPDEHNAKFMRPGFDLVNRRFSFPSFSPSNFGRGCTIDNGRALTGPIPPAGAFGRGIG